MFFALDRADRDAIVQAIRDGFAGVKINVAGGAVTTGGAGTTTTGGGSAGTTGGSGTAGGAVTTDGDGTGSIDYLKKASEDLGSKLKETLGSNFPGVENLVESFKDVQEGAQMVYKEFGLTREMTAEISKSMGDSKYSVIAMGGTLEDSFSTLKEISQATGRAFLSGGEAVDDLFALQQILGEYPTTLVKGFQDIGVGVHQIGEQTNDVIKMSSSLGLNAKQVTKGVLDNLEKLNTYNFQNGVQGLAKMAAQATMFKTDMGSTLKLAEDLLSPEKAIEMAAGLQRLGVASSDLIDPLRLMDMAQNNPEQLQEEIIELTKQFTYFDEKTKTIKILPDGQRIIREIAPLVGKTTQEFANLAIQSGLVEEKMKKISLPNFSGGLSDEDKNLIVNLAEMNKGGTAYTVKFSDERGNLIEKAVDQLNENDLKRIKEQQTANEKLKDPVELAKAQMTATERLASALDSFSKRIPTEAGSSEVAEKIAEGMVKLGEVTEKIANKGFEYGEDKMFGAEAIDARLLKYFEEGKFNTEKAKTDLENFGQKLTDVADKLSKMDFGQIIEEGKKFIKEGATAIMTATAESIKEVLATSNDAIIRARLEAFLEDTKKTLVILAEGTKTDLPNVEEKKSDVTLEKEETTKVENISNVEGDDTIIENTTNVKLNGEDTLNIDNKGNLLAGTDLLNLKEVIANFSSQITEKFQVLIETLSKDGGNENVRVKIEEIVSKIQLLVDEKSYETIQKDMIDKIPHEKTLNLKMIRDAESEEQYKKLTEPIEQLVKYKLENQDKELDIEVVVKNEKETITLIEELSKGRVIDFSINPKVIEDMKTNMMSFLDEMKDNLSVLNFGSLEFPYESMEEFKTEYNKILEKNEISIDTKRAQEELVKIEPRHLKQIPIEYKEPELFKPELKEIPVELKPKEMDEKKVQIPVEYEGMEELPTSEAKVNFKTEGIDKITEEMDQIPKKIEPKITFGTRDLDETETKIQSMMRDEKPKKFLFETEGLDLEELEILKKEKPMIPLGFDMNNEGLIKLYEEKKKISEPIGFHLNFDKADENLIGLQSKFSEFEKPLTIETLISMNEESQKSLEKIEGLEKPKETTFSLFTNQNDFDDIDRKYKSITNKIISPEINLSASETKQPLQGMEMGSLGTTSFNKDQRNIIGPEEMRPEIVVEQPSIATRPSLEMAQFPSIKQDQNFNMQGGFSIEHKFSFDNVPANMNSDDFQRNMKKYFDNPYLANNLMELMKKQMTGYGQNSIQNSPGGLQKKP